MCGRRCRCRCGCGSPSLSGSAGCEPAAPGARVDAAGAAALCQPPACTERRCDVGRHVLGERMCVCVRDIDCVLLLIVYYIWTVPALACSGLDEKFPVALEGDARQTGGSGERWAACAFIGRGGTVVSKTTLFGRFRTSGQMGGADTRPRTHHHSQQHSGRILRNSNGDSFCTFFLGRVTGRES